MTPVETLMREAFRTLHCIGRIATGMLPAAFTGLSQIL